MNPPDPKTQPNLHEILQHARHLVALLEDCHPELFSWLEQLDDTLVKIVKFRLGGVEDL